MENRIALRMQGISKRYHLGRAVTLNARLQTALARILGREDPNTRLGEACKDREFYALRDIDLTVYCGEALGIIGRNGAGKSTLLKLLSRVTAPTCGCIDLYGGVTSMLEVGTGFHPELTGRENVYLNGAILGMSRRQIREKLPEIVEFSEIGEFLDTPVKRYSSGMYVKLAFSVAASLDSPILIMDEVLAVGDMAFQEKCLARMEQARQQGRTVLYVSHNLHTVRRLCSRCVLLERGRIVYDGEPEEAIRRYLGDTGTGRVRDCAHLPREPICRGGGRLLRTELLENGEKLRFLLDFSLEKPVPDLKFRMILFSAGVPVGRMTADPGATPGRNRRELTFDLALLAPGSYTARAVLYRENHLGGEEILDVADPALVFRREGAGEVWKENVWGHIRFPEGEARHAD